MQESTIIYIILSGIIALLLALFQYIYKSKSKSNSHKFLAVLRFVTLFAIMLLLINPKFEQTTYYNEKPTLVIATDNSESVRYLNQSNNTNELIERLKANDSLNENFNLEFYTFGKTLSKTDSLSYSDRQSNMALAFDRLSEIYSNSVAPTLLITDGNQTYGNDYEFSTNKYKQPIYPIILGDTTQFIDLKIQQLNVNKYAYLKNRFPIEAILVYSGEGSVSTTFNITSGNTVVYSQNINFTATSTSKVINLTLPANRAGVSSYKAEIVPIENEKNTVNNIKNFAVEVIDQKTNVAIVSDILHPDIGALKKSIESNEQRQATLVTPEEFVSNAGDYQLAIVYQPNMKFKQAFDEINRLKINKWVIAGTKTSWNALNALQSNYKQTITNQTEDFLPELNLNYTPFIIENVSFDEFPPLRSEYGETEFNLPIQTICYKTVNGIAIGEPLLATFEINETREALLNGEGIWKWRAQSFLEQKSFEPFDNFIGKMVQYLSSKQRRTRLNVEYESFYNGNEDLKINAQYFNKNYEFDTSGNLNITLKDKETNNSRTLPFVLKNNGYQVDLSGIPAGEYSFTVSVTGENVSQSGELKILDYNVEQQFLNADVAKLERLAASTKGNSFFIDNTSSLVKTLTSDTRFATLQKSSKNVVPLIDWKYLLAVIVLSLTAEWFIRKYNGLI
ncbi:VWA domain-containing protein [Gaetbulibacter sp. PBL-D1]|uniref:VWA domain-containing protein n=1 Tax=Gaetbulibacter sp. PBL-D1 TaxID=3422594 RepID=UPI003D2EB943